MEATPELISQITSMVLAALNAEQAPCAGVQPVLVAAGDTAPFAAAGLPCAGIDAYDGAAEPFSAVVFTEASTALLADMAIGRDASKAACACSKALLAGVPVYVAAEGLAHRRCHDTAQARYYALLEGYVQRLEQYGVVVAPLTEVVARLAASAGTGTSGGVAACRRASAADEPGIDGLITASRAEDLARTGVKEVSLRASAKLTPLARDVLRDHDIALRWL